ncbi:hypothetical protein VPIG_00205 [Vibrio phage PWH3a-P1]|uniref:hypothetical protein n=1 Tax=Vibrio phage PWH3a-P1 TaxID=754058 RepID=UPI0002C0E16B|nr:hypothetical protein VPIG_00205 [Vibrio phage PWH3a-P1]AGH32061.1 hypothetical protein VPIG_00205 [Vibrio phage PWH3a-P1]
MAKFDIFMDVTGEDDLDFSDGIDFRWTETIQESLVQRLQLRYEVWTGEWGYNLEFGTPYRDYMQQGLNKAQLDAEFIRIALQEEDITSVKIINSSLDKVNRSYEIQSLEVYTDGGLLTIPISNPYTKTNTYPEPYEFTDFTFCKKTDQEIEDYNKLYDFINFSGLPEFGNSTWWNTWGGTDPI